MVYDNKSQLILKLNSIYMEIFTNRQHSPKQVQSYLAQKTCQSIKMDIINVIWSNTPKDYLIYFVCKNDKIWFLTDLKSNFPSTISRPITGVGGGNADIDGGIELGGIPKVCCPVACMWWGLKLTNCCVNLWGGGT